MREKCKKILKVLTLAWGFLFVLLRLLTINNTWTEVYCAQMSAKGIPLTPDSE